MGVYDADITATITDISTPGSEWVRAPRNGFVVAIYCVIQNAITVANTIITPKIGGTNMTAGAITIAFSGSAAGTKDESFPTAPNYVNAGDNIELACDGGSTTACRANFTIVIK